MEAIKDRALNALSWSFIQEILMRGLQFGVQIFLARLLIPKEFGLVAMLGIFIGVAQTLVDGGFASALIQAKEVTEEQKCSIFYFNIAGSLLLAGILYAAAPLISDFYQQPLLTSLLRALAWLPVINGFGLVQNTLLVKHLEVKKQTIVLATSTIISGTIAVVLGWRGFGVWALAYYQLSQSLIRTVLLWHFNSWRPKFIFSFAALRGMFKFGGGMLASVILASTYDNLYPLLIGKFFSPESLGYFNRAQSVQSVASQGLGAVANRVTFPVFATLQDDLRRFRVGLRKAVTTVTFLQFPLMIGLAVVSKPLILLVFTDKWAQSVPYLQLLAFAGMFFPLHVLNLNVLIALGRSDLFLRLEIFKVTFFLVTGLLTFHWGVQALICGQMVCEVFGYVLNGYYTKKLINYSIWNQIHDFYPCLVASVVMGLAVFLLGKCLPVGNLLKLICQVIFGAICYLGISYSMRLSAFVQILDIFWRRTSAVVDNPI